MTLAELSSGSVFEFEDCLYQRIEDPSCLIETFSTEDYKYLPTLRLDDGMLILMNSTTEVYRYGSEVWG